MLADFFATKLKMTQVWTDQGKRLPVTIVKATDMKVVGQQPLKVGGAIDETNTVLEVGVGARKLSNVPKSLRSRLSKQGFTEGVSNVAGIQVATENIADSIKPGSVIAVTDILSVGDMVSVQGTSKGKGFAGAMKRHNFSGGPKTHGQSDRERAVGSIGQGTTPGRVYKGKKMPGHMGVETVSVSGCVVIHIDQENQEVWLSGPIPGSTQSVVRIRKTGDTKSIALDTAASGIPEAPAAETPAEEATQE